MHHVERMRDWLIFCLLETNEEEISLKTTENEIAGTRYTLSPNNRRCRSTRKMRKKKRTTTKNNNIDDDNNKNKI